MPLLHKFEIRISDISISRVRKELPRRSLARPFRDFVAVAIGISVLSFHYCQPASAQVVHVETTQMAILHGTRPDAPRSGAGETSPSALGAATSTNPAAVPL